MILSRLLLYCLVTFAVSQSTFICGPEGFQFESDVPCNSYPICSNGGFKLFIGCQNDITCSLYSPSSVCVDQMCCTGGVLTIAAPIEAVTLHPRTNSGEAMHLDGTMHSK